MIIIVLQFPEAYHLIQKKKKNHIYPKHKLTYNILKQLTLRILKSMDINTGIKIQQDEKYWESGKHKNTKIKKENKQLKGSNEFVKATHHYVLVPMGSRISKRNIQNYLRNSNNDSAFTSQ